MRRIIQVEYFLFRHLYQLGEWNAIKGTMRMLSRSADGPLFTLLPVALVLLDWRIAVRLFALQIIGFLIQIPIYTALKKSTRRQRPFFRLPDVHQRIIPPDQFSFPSGHTAAATLLFVLLSTLIPEWKAPLLLWAVGVGLSRILLGVHFLSDVLAGCLLGFLCAQFALTFEHFLFLWL